MTKPILLLVEDEKDLQEVLIDLLSALECEIKVANDGQEALEMCKAHRVTAILSDINMPRKNGLEFLKDLRAAGYETPIVFLSGYGDKAKVTEALRLGALDFLDKPFEEQLVLQVVTRALEYGKSLAEFDDFFHNIEQKMNLPNEEIQKIREAKKHIWMIRFESAYKSKHQAA